MSESPPLLMLFGGFDPPNRAVDVVAGRCALSDAWILEKEFNATVLDFGWLDARSRAAWTRRALARIAQRNGSWSVMLALASARRVRRSRAVYVTGEDVGIIAAAVSHLIPGRRKPWIIVRFERSAAGRTHWRRSLHRSLLRFASPCIGVALCRTRAVADGLLRDSRIPGGRIQVFGQEVDTEFYDPSRVTSGANLIEGVYLLSAGLEHRDYSTLLAAVEDLPVRLIIAAGSPWSKDAFKVDRDLPRNVSVDTFNPQEMRELYRSAALVVISVLPTERSCGISVLDEAWAMKRPVVASATEGLSEYIEHRHNAILVPPGDVNAMRLAIDELLHDPELAKRLAANGHEYVRANLALNRFAAAVVDALRVGGIVWERSAL